ncbi:hypothetical protein [Variovorax gossypii]
MPGLTAIDLKLQALRRDRYTRSDLDDYLFDALPTLAEWQHATAAKTGSRGKTSNPEILQIDAELLNYRNIARGSRATAIRKIGEIIARWRLRRGQNAQNSLRLGAMDAMEEIVTILCDTVVYDRAKWLLLQDYTSAYPDRIPGGFSENGKTVQRLRKSLIEEFSNMGSAARVNDSMNEAYKRIVQAYGLKPGADFHGGAACFSAATWAAQHIAGEITSYCNKRTTYKISEPQVERNSNDTHRYVIDKNGVIIDPTWRQFFRGSQLGGTPAIFAGKLNDLVEIALDAKLDTGKLAAIYSGKSASKQAEDSSKES